jgi:hypothetical protein
LVPVGFEVLEWDRRDRFRWSPGVFVERIDWEVLAVHSDAPVRKMAEEYLGREGRKRSGEH